MKDKPLAVAARHCLNSKYARSLFNVLFIKNIWYILVIEKNVWGFNKIIQLFALWNLYSEGPIHFGCPFVRKHGVEPWPSISDGGITKEDGALES